MPDEARLIVAFALALGAAFAATPVAISTAARVDFLDKPVGYKGHAAPTPYLGGAAVLGGFALGALTLGGEFARLSPIFVSAFALWALGGEVTPLNFIRSMRLPNGKRPRMDLYGHNPFTSRTPDLSNRPLRFGFADFSDLDTLAGWLDRYGYRTPQHRRLRLFLSELVIPTDHKNTEFNFWVDRATQANWIRAALRITRRSRRIYTLGYLGLYDDPRRADGLEVNRGLIDRQGRKKPAYRAYKRG